MPPRDSQRRARLRGSGIELAGRAQMIRTADETTIVAIHVTGRGPDTTYGARRGREGRLADGSPVTIVDPNPNVLSKAPLTA
jgi:hypothetical protein